MVAFHLKVCILYIDHMIKTLLLIHNLHYVFDEECIPMCTMKLMRKKICI